MERSRTRRLGVVASVLVAGVLLTSGSATGGAVLESSGNSDSLIRTKTVFLTQTSGRPFGYVSAFNSPIGAHPRIDPNTRAMVNVLAGRGYATAQVYADTPPVYHANSKTPRYKIRCTKDWGRCDLETQSVPIPKWAVPSTGSDASMVVIDWTTGQTYEFWQFNKANKTASWGAVMPIVGSGTGNGVRDTGRYGAVGAGVSRLAGVVRTFEVRRGVINHALVGPTGFSCKGEYRYPAVKTDGWSSSGSCIPEGARVQLDPSVKCAGLPQIKKWEVMVCKALQTYGWYNIDNGNVGNAGFGIQFENPTATKDPYKKRGIREYSAIRSIPLNKLRVLTGWDSYQR